MKRLTKQEYTTKIKTSDLSCYTSIYLKITKYENTGFEPEEIEALKQSEEYWHREAIRWAAELGELKIWLES